MRDAAANVCEGKRGCACLGGACLLRTLAIDCVMSAREASTWRQGVTQQAAHEARHVTATSCMRFSRSLSSSVARQRAVSSSIPSTAGTGLEGRQPWLYSCRPSFSTCAPRINQKVGFKDAYKQQQVIYWMHNVHRTDTGAASEEQELHEIWQEEKSEIARGCCVAALERAW